MHRIINGAGTLVCTFALLAGAADCGAARHDPLPSWNDGPVKSAVLDFVQRVTTEGGTKFVPSAEHIATFDNDGCLWSEQPMYFQLAFALDRVKTLAPMHPEWRRKQPFKSVLEGELDKGLDEAKKRGWTVVDMKKDWKVIYPFQR